VPWGRGRGRKFVAEHKPFARREGGKVLIDQAIKAKRGRRGKATSVERVDGQAAPERGRKSDVFMSTGKGAGLCR